MHLELIAILGLTGLPLVAAKQTYEIEELQDIFHHADSSQATMSQVPPIQTNTWEKKNTRVWWRTVKEIIVPIAYTIKVTGA